MKYAWQQWEHDMAKTLKDHEEVCSMRYAAIEKRLDNLDAKIDGIHKEIDGFKTFWLENNTWEDECWKPKRKESN